MAHDWDAYAAEWENDPVTTAYAEKAFESLQQWLDINNQHVLDFGCGTGLLTQKIAPLAKGVVALDSSEAMIEQLDRKQLGNNVEAVVDHLTRGLVAMHPAFRGQFDVVVASSVCGFLPNYSDVVDIIYSILENDGAFIQWDWLDAENGLTTDYVQTVLSSVGFKEVSVSVPFTLETAQGERQVLMAIGKK